MKNCVYWSLALLACATPAFADVAVSSPGNGETVGSPTQYVATASTSTCSQGVASMGVYVNNQLVYVANGASLDTPIDLGPGAQHTVVEEWDRCGGATYATLNVNVEGGGTALTNLQSSGGWRSWGELTPDYNICTAACPGVNWSMTQGVRSPSLSGSATQFSIGGNKPYSDVLWSNPIIGQNSTQNLPDSDHTLLPNLHNFTYDAWVYVTNASATQVLEFDVNMYLDGAGMTWGNQCRIAGGNQWDIWDNAASQWVPTGVACNPINNGWNHVIIQVQRQPDNTLLYQSITLNGATTTINRVSTPTPVPSGWWGITVNYQMDGNYNQTANTTYLDNFKFIYN
jgi:hypothetical protein